MAVLLVAGLSALPTETGTAGGLGLLIAVPAYLIALPLMLVGAWRTINLGDDPRLWVLSALTAIYLANFFLEFIPMPLYNAVPVVYGGITVLVGLYWFLRIRPGRAQ